MQRLKLSRGKILNIYQGTTGSDISIGWNPISTGVNGFVFTIDQDMSTNIVYTGGRFSQAGGLTAGRIASWNGASWGYLNGGVRNSSFPNLTAVNAIAINSATGKIYVGGSFDEAPPGSGPGTFSNIAEYTIATGTWSNMGGGVNNPVNTIAISGSNVYVGGTFTQAGSGGGAVTANRIALWNGSTWSALVNGGNNGLNSDVNTIAISGSNVYVGGAFTATGGTGSIAANYIALWNGTTFSALGTGLNAQCRSIVIGTGGDLYFGGNFNTAGGSTRIGIVKYNGGTYSSIGNLVASGATDGIAYGMYFLNNILYVCGNFVTAGGVSTSNFGIYNTLTSTWSTLPGVTFNSVCWSVRVDNNNNIYVGGEFTTPQAYITIYSPSVVPGSSTTSAAARDTKSFSKRIRLS